MKNKILKLVTTIAAIIFIVAGCMLDSASYVPYIVCSICLAWICLFIYANRDRLGDGVE